MLKKCVRVLLLSGVFLSITTWAISQLAPGSFEDLYKQMELFSYALTTVHSEYVDEKKPRELIYGALRGMLSSLDPHSQFLDPDEYKELKTETQGRFGGLGIEISIRDGLLTIITPIEGTPAWKEGLKAGDRIVLIEDEETKDMSLNDAVKRLRGDPGTKVKITVLRESERRLIDFTITREIIKVQDVKDVQVLTDKIGYLRLVEFRENSHKEFWKALTKLKEEGADSLILDLRNNPGGLLNVAIAITEEFLPEGTLIVSTKGRRPSQNTETYARKTPKKILDWPIVVLINKGSASGSEILAGALKDNKRALILGTQSFGKGSVQSVIPLPDGSGLRLTTSKYFTPSGISIHGVGITPDIVVPYVPPPESSEVDQDKQKVEKIFEDVKEYEKKEKGEQGEGDETDPEKKALREARKWLLKDNQVQAAIRVIKGIRVYRTFPGIGTTEAAAKPEASASPTEAAGAAVPSSGEDMKGSPVGTEAP